MEKKKIGVPRSLLYYKYFAFWKKFFEELGFEVIVSDETSSDILKEGNKYAIDEICIPLKLYYGHIINVVNKKPDYLFIPRYVSLSPGTYMCPKFLGLPDLIRGTVSNLPDVIEMCVDSRKKTKFYSACETGRALNKSFMQVKNAYRCAVESYRCFCDVMEKGFSFTESVDIADKKPDNLLKKEYPDTEVSIAVIGHSYNVHDSFINMDLLNKLEKMNVRPVVLENLPSEIFKGETRINKSLKNYWGNEEEILSALNYLFGKKSVDGIIFLCSFCCGPDSLVDEITTRNAKLTGIPYTCVVMDEHSGQTGLITRIESFVDMVAFKKRKGGIRQCL
ncbi:MAG TPA: acyl-CoA dehydratase activase-related protein [bacterium]|nr:acyl-CoA dehydratase activase-related protein [bacterium]